MTDSEVMEKTPFKRRIYNVAGFMGASAIFISGVIIVWFNSVFSPDQWSGFYNQFGLAAITLMPYMISAVVAAITAIGIMYILPSARMAEPAEKIMQRVKDLRDGDLSYTLKLNGEGQVREMTQALNNAITGLSSNITDLKIINRQQWGLLCEIRMWAENHDCETILVYVREMEKNWDKIADIEERFRT
ncbi:MAG: hypothetical protein ACOYVF_15105 [Candidatus Zixiibacteriota bacterium]